MFGKLLFVALIGLCCASFFEKALNRLAPVRNDVHRFAVNIPKEGGKEISKLGNNAKGLLGKLQSSLLLKGVPLGTYRPEQLLPLFGLKTPSPGEGQASASRLRLTKFNVANCSEADAEKTLFVVKKLDIQPDPAVLPGDLNISFDIDVLKTISKLRIDLGLAIKEGDNYIKVPCIGGFGSCPYDVCERLSAVTDCPAPLVDNHIPCKCPFNKNEYNLPSIVASIQTEVFVTGSYNVTVNMTSGKRFVGCYNANFTISSGDEM